MEAGQKMKLLMFEKIMQSSITKHAPAQTATTPYLSLPI